jgi:hypothetical protein
MKVSEALIVFNRIDAQCRHALENTPSPPREINRAYWHAVADVFAAYTTVENGVRTGKMSEAFPPNIAIVMKGILEYLLAGKMPEPFEDLLSQGTPRAGPSEVRDKRNAALYMEAVRSGLIKDRSPNKSVREAYGVVESTVRSWANEYTGRLANWNQEWAMETRALIIEKNMRKSGRRYSQAGRSINAITNRGQI